MSRPREYPRVVARRDALEAAVKASGLNRYELANRVGVSITYATHVRKGLSVPLRVGTAFAAALNEKIELLFNVVRKAPRKAA